MTYHIFAITGKYAIPEELGLALQESLIPVMKGGYIVTLDFAGVVGIRTNFLFCLLQGLMKEFAPADLNRQLRFVNLPTSAYSTFHYVIDRIKATL